MAVPKIRNNHDPETRNIINRAIEVLNQQGKTMQDLVAEGQLTEEQYAQLIKVVNGLVDSEYVDALFSRLGSAKPSGAFATLSELENAYPNGDKNNYYVVIEDNNWYYWDGQWKAGGLFNATVSDEMPATNIIKNSDFNDGLSGGWTSTRSENSVSNKVLTNTADGTRNYGRVAQDVNNLTIGDKYYFRAILKSTNDSTEDLRIGINYSEETPFLINNPEKDKTYDVSSIFTVTNTSAAFYIMHYYASEAETNNKEMQVQYVLAINITKIFGAGYEPSANELDDIMSSYAGSHFNGTVSPFVDKKNILKKLEDRTLIQEIEGTSTQIEVENRNGVGGNPKISIPRGPTGLMRPEVSSVSFDDDISPPLEDWTSDDGATFDGTKWTIPEKSTLRTTVDVVEGEEYEIDISWSDTTNYLLSFPRLILSMGTVKSPPIFAGFSDARYHLTLVAAESGTVDFKIGDGVENWYAEIDGVTIKKVTEKVSRAGRLGNGNYYITTQGDNFAIGKGHEERTSGRANHALGLEAQKDVTTGSFNVAMGIFAQHNLTIGRNNVGFGSYAQRYLQSGYYNIGIGYSAQSKLISGSWNIGIGNESQRDLTSGDRNTTVGSRAHNSLTEGNYNVAMGREAGFFPKEINRPTTVADNQTTIGSRSGQSDTSKADNLTTLGFHSIGSRNATALGAYTEAKGAGSVAIGLDSGGDFAIANLDDDFILGTKKQHVKVPGKFNVAQYTPSGTDDDLGLAGDITTDDDYIYVKTNQGWKRSSLETF